MHVTTRQQTLVPEWYYNKSDLTISNRITTVILQSGREGQTKYPGDITANKLITKFSHKKISYS